MNYHQRIFAVSILVLSLFSGRVGAASGKEDTIVWQEWSPEVFQQAKKEKKMVLLDLGAVWCHWCHVMDEQTYGDPAVVALIQKHFIAVRVDQDSRPDLANRYGDYGWPATILFTGEGKELAKRRGYLPPVPMAAMLDAFVKDPTPGPSVKEIPAIQVSSSSSLSVSEQKELETLFRKGYDRKLGGWGFDQKFLDWNSVEYALTLAQAKDPDGSGMARGTLAAQIKLMDPVWGGVYQYSTDGDWVHPHFEKLLQFQAENMRIYALASTLWPHDGYLRKAQAIENYIANFLTSPEGAVYTSQDADLIQGKHSADYFALDDKARRKLGIPRVDKTIYARENGWYIQALIALAGAAGDREKMDKAGHLAEWIVKERGISGGGFRHAAKDSSGPYLGDTLSMATAFLALYGGTGNREWLAQAELSADFMEKHFRSSKNQGYVTSVAGGEGMFPAQALIGENVEMVRFANLLFHYTGNERYRNMSQFAMTHLVANAPLADGSVRAGILLANHEIDQDPLHITVVGSKDDPGARKLFQMALALPGTYKQTEWLDSLEGPLPGAQIEYPRLKTPAIFICNQGSCSSPMTTEEQLRNFVKGHLQ